MTTGSDGVNWTLFTNGNFGRSYTHSWFGSHEFTPRLTAWGSIQPSPHRRIFFHNNPGDSYTMVWWGWMVTNFTGTMYFTQVTDDDFELWIHPTDFNRPDTEGATRVIQGNNWRPWFYGSYDVTKGTVYHTKMYMGEGGGGDDSVFYWNTTGPASAAGFGHSGGDNREQWPGSTGTMENFSYLDGTVEDTGKSGNSSWPTGGIPDLPGGDLPNAGDDPTDGDFALWFTTREKAEAYIASLSGGGGGGASVIANPLTSVDRNYNSNWVISVDKWDSYRSIGYQGNLDVAPIQAASVIAGGGGFDGSFNVVDASFRTQGDASSNWFSSSHPAQMAFNNDISFVGGQYFAVENVSAYQNGTIVSDSDNSAVKLDFLFPYPRTATEYEILPPNEISNNDALYMPNRWCIYGSKSETIDTTLPSTESNGYFLLDSRADAKPWSAHDASLISVSGGKKYIIANPGLYRQYRMSILQNSGDPAGNINIGELIYYEGGVGPLVGGGALDGRSDLSGGLAFHGDVSGVIGHSDGSFVTKIFDGSDNSLYKSPIGAFENYDLSAGKEFAVKFELPSKKKILKYDIKNTNIKSWTLRGCDNSAIYDRTDSNTYELLHGVSDFIDSSKSCIVSNPKDYTYYVLDVSSSNITDSAELGELIYYDTGSYPSAGAGSLDGSSGDVGGLLIHGDVEGVGGQSDWAALSGGLGAHGDISGVNGFEPLINYTVDVSLNRFTLNDDLQPELTLYRGETYNFNQSNIDNSGQRLFVSNDISGRLVASTTYQLLAGGNGSENSNTLRGTGGNDGIVSSNNWNSGYTLSRVFNGTLSDAQDGWHTGSNTYPANLIFTFPNPVVIYKYKVWPRQRPSNYSDTHPPKIWQLRGVSLTNINDYDQNDSSTYTVLHEQNVPQLWNVHWFNQVQTIDITNDTKRQEYIFSTPGLYKHYVFHVIESQYGTSGATFIGEIAYYGGTPASYSLSENSAGFITTGTLGTDLSSSWTIPADVSDTMYYASDGSANAGGIINIENYSNYDVSNIYDGSNITVYKSPIGAFDNYDLSAGKEFAVKMDFPSSKKILRYDLNNINLKSWTLRGTDNSVNYDRTDSNTYEVLDSNVDFSYVVSNNSGILNHSNDSIPDTLPSSPNNVSKPEGTWLRVRHMHTGATRGYDTNTNLDGTWEYNHTTMNDNEIWAIKFDHLEFDQFLFFADNYQRWMIIEKDELFKQPNNGSFTVLQSSYSDSSYISYFYNRGSPPGDSPDYDPLVCITNWITDDCLYIEANYSNINQHEMIARPWDVYIRISEISPFVPGSSSTTRIISNPKDYTYYVLDSSASNDISSAEIGELIVYESRVKLSHSTSLFNGTLSDASDAFISDSGVFSNNSLTSGSEFSVKFEFPTKKYISTYRIWPQIDGSMNSPSDWYLHGCDVSSLYDRADESTYNVLDVRSGENSWPVTSASSIGDLSGYNEYTIIDPGNYSYYVLDVSASNNASLCSIGELAYYESERVDVTTIREPQSYENHQLAINMGASEETSDWEVGEIIVFNKKLTSEEEEKVVSYLENTFYGSDGFEPVGNNSTLRLTRNNLRLPEVYSAMDPSARGIEYFNQSDYNRVVNMNLSSINYQDISSIPIKTSDLRNRLLSTDASFTTITGVNKGYTPSSIVKLSDFRGATSGGGSGDGGTLTNFDGYNIHSFTTVGTHTFTVAGSITVEFLIVGGGGGGGMDMGGGGGGGGVVKGIDYTLDSGEYIITVGDGGIGAPKGSNDAYPIGQGRTGHTYTHNGKNGDDSSIVGGTVNFIGKGGGYGGSAPHNHTLGGKGNLGGSGGGTSGYNSNSSTVQADTSQDTYTAIEGVAGYGNKGGPASGIAHYASGGGGAGGIGLTAVGTSVYPEGGPGIESDILGTSYYWGGGGGGSGNSQNGGNGGDGGGGGGAVGTTTGGGGLNSGSPGGGGNTNSQTNTPGGNAGANTGGGGGGGSHYNETNQGGNGGSGIVVIRYK